MSFRDFQDKDLRGVIGLRQSFSEMGFLCLPDFFSPPECRRFVSALRELRRIQPHTKNLLLYPLFDSLVMNERLLCLARQFLGPTRFSIMPMVGCFLITGSKSHGIMISTVMSRSRTSSIR